MADRLDRVNQGLSRENSRLKSQFKSQEDDRKFLIKQLVAIKVRIGYRMERLCAGTYARRGDGGSSPSLKLGTQPYHFVVFLLQNSLSLSRETLLCVQTTPPPLPIHSYMTPPSNSLREHLISE